MTIYEFSAKYLFEPGKFEPEQHAKTLLKKQDLAQPKTEDVDDHVHEHVNEDD